MDEILTFSNEAKAGIRLTAILICIFAEAAIVVPVVCVKIMVRIIYTFINTFVIIYICVCVCVCVDVPVEYQNKNHAFLYQDSDHEQLLEMMN